MCRQNFPGQNFPGKVVRFSGKFCQGTFWGLDNFSLRGNFVQGNFVCTYYITVKVLNDIAALYVTMPVGLCGSLSLSLLVSQFVCLSPRSDLKYNTPLKIKYDGCILCFNFPSKF